MFEKRKPIYEKLSLKEHPEHQEVNTSVAEYLRKYGQGKIDAMPTDPRPEVEDSRTVDEMLDSNEFEPSLGTDELDVLAELERMRAAYNNAEADLKATEKQKEAFDNAVKIINDNNSSTAERAEAFEVLKDLEAKGKIKRARAYD